MPQNPLGFSAKGASKGWRQRVLNYATVLDGESDLLLALTASPSPSLGTAKMAAARRPCCLGGAVLVLDLCRGFLS